jgi:hypothetical protein
MYIGCDASKIKQTAAPSTQKRSGRVQKETRENKRIMREQEERGMQVRFVIWTRQTLWRAWISAEHKEAQKLGTPPRSGARVQLAHHAVGGARF